LTWIKSKHKILFDKNLWKIIDEQLAEVILEDKVGRQTTFLIMVSAFLERPCNLFLLGESAIGKTWLAAKCAELLPTNNIVKIGSATQRAWFYCGKPVYKEHPLIPSKKVIDYYLVDWRNKVVMLLDNITEKTIKDLKPVMSHDANEIDIWVTEKTKENKNKTIKVKVLGSPSFIICSTNISWNEELSTRHFILTPLDDPRKYLAAGNLIKLRETSGVEPKPSRAEEIKEAIQFLIQQNIKVIVKPEVAERIKAKFCWKSGKDVRDYERALALLKASAWLHAFQREKDENKRIIADERDLEIIEPLLNAVLITSHYATSSQVLEFLERVLKPLAKESEGEDLGREKIFEKYLEVYGRVISYSTLSKYINILEDIGEIMVVEDKQDRRRRLVRVLKPEKILFHADIPPMCMNESLHTYIGGYSKWNNILPNSSTPLGIKDVCGYCWQKNYANFEGTLAERMGKVSEGLCHDCGKRLAEIRIRLNSSPYSKQSKPIIHVSFVDRAVVMRIVDPLSEEPFQALNWQIGEVKLKSEILSYFKEKFGEKGIEKATEWIFQAFDEKRVEFDSIVESEALYKRVR
jgi:hypothetical protein